MKLIKEIRDVESISIIGEKFSYKSNSKLFEYTGNDSKLILDNVYDYYYTDGFLYYQERNLESLYRLNIQSKEVEELQGLYSLRGAFGTSQDSLYILGKNINEKAYFKISKDNFELQCIIPYFRGLPMIFDKNFCIVMYHYSIKSFSPLFDDELWHYSLPEGFKVYVSVQAIDHILFFTATSRNLEHSKLIGLHIDTGEVLWEFENLIDFQVDHKHQLLRGYGGAFYQVIDPFAGKLLVNNYFKELWDKGIDPTSYDNTIVGDKLWFVSGRGKSAKFGTVDTTTSEVDFIQDFPIENGSQFNKPVFHQGKLFLRDNDNLYIFE